MSKLQYRGPFNSITPCGHKPSLMKSMLQKSVRREWNELFRYSLLELYAFQDVLNGQGLVTNLFNRLKVITCEEFFDFRKIAIMDKYLDILTSDRFDKDKKIQALLNIERLLLSGNKIRLVSYLKNWSCTAKVFEFDEDHIDPEYSDVFEVSDDECAIGNHYLNLSTPEPLRDDLILFVHCLNQTSDKRPLMFLSNMIKYVIDNNVSVWCKCPDTGRSKKGIEIVIWDIMIKKCKQPDYACFAETMGILYKWYSATTSEFHVFLYYALTMLINKPLLKHEIETPLEVVEYSEPEAKTLYQKHHAELKQLQMTEEQKDIICDMHVNHDKTTAHFAQVSSVVVNEETKYDVQKYKDLYLKMKISPTLATFKKATFKKNSTKTKLLLQKVAQKQS
jgi:hypothetical protein